MQFNQPARLQQICHHRPRQTADAQSFCSGALDRFRIAELAGRWQMMQIRQQGMFHLPQARHMLDAANTIEQQFLKPDQAGAGSKACSTASRVPDPGSRSNQSAWSR